MRNRRRVKPEAPNLLYRCFVIVVIHGIGEQELRAAFGGIPLDW